jgi:hypothetical protein
VMKKDRISTMTSVEADRNTVEMRFLAMDYKRL